MQTKGIEKRIHKRVLFTPEDGIIGEFDLPGNAEENFTANIINMSQGGLHFTFPKYLSNSIKKGDRLILTNIKDNKSNELMVNVDTEVRWISVDKLSKNIGVGSEFLDLKDVQSNKIKEYLDLWYLQRIPCNGND